MFRTPTTRFALVLVAATVASLCAIPAADAGGPAPQPNDFDLEAVYVQCVDDQGEPPVDGDALVHVRLTNDSPDHVDVTAGSYQLVADGETLHEGALYTPVELPIGDTYVQVAVIPGGTAASFEVTVDVTNQSGTTTLDLQPALVVPGDCPQPDEPDAPAGPNDEPTSSEIDDKVTVRPRFTG